MQAVDRLIAPAIVKSLNLECPKVKASTPTTSANNVTSSNLPSAQQPASSSSMSPTTGPQISLSFTSDTPPVTSSKAPSIQSQDLAVPLPSVLPEVNTSGKTDGSGTTRSYLRAQTYQRSHRQPLS